jgi:uncharacterized membrane protein
MLGMLVINPRYLTHIDTTRAPMKNILYTYLATLACLGVLDLAYLGTFGIKLFKQQLGPGVLRERPVAAAAVLFYLMYSAGVVYFVVLPHSTLGVAGVGIEGALLGLLAYGTYDLTNMATLNKWTWLLVVLDMIWGGLVTGVAAAVGAYVAGLA